MYVCMYVCMYVRTYVTGGREGEGREGEGGGGGGGRGRKGCNNNTPGSHIKIYALQSLFVYESVCVPVCLSVCPPMIYVTMTWGVHAYIYIDQVFNAFSSQSPPAQIWSSMPIHNNMNPRHFFLQSPPPPPVCLLYTGMRHPFISSCCLSDVMTLGYKVRPGAYGPRMVRSNYYLQRQSENDWEHHTRLQWHGELFLQPARRIPQTTSEGGWLVVGDKLLDGCLWQRAIFQHTIEWLY